MNPEIFKTEDPSGRFSKEKYVSGNHPEEYEAVIGFSETNNLTHLTFKEKVYLFVNGIGKAPVCKNPNCGKPTKYRNSTLGFSEYCSKKCVSSDPGIKKSKEEKSFLKFGTKTPAESDQVKKKALETNRKKYGGDSPMSSMEIQQKSKDTLMKNWGVDNPNKNPEIVERRIETFKSGNYRETFKKTSMERYGVEHPWMNPEIHQKSIKVFYEYYKSRIEKRIESQNVTFLRFDKSGTTKLHFLCHDCDGEFDILTYQFYHRTNDKTKICTKCFPISENSSIDQVELFRFISENYGGTVISNDRKEILPYEIDIYLPDVKIGFEFNGTFWHSVKFKDKDCHLKKLESARKKGIRLITIWEDEWTTKKDICKSFVLNKIGVVGTKIHARKCEIREIPYSESKLFLDENHLQGDCKSPIRLGLFHMGELVSLMTFSKLRLPLSSKSKTGTYELTRFCNLKNHQVMGGASKILRHFISKWSPESIETYSDNMISDGRLYEKLGFSYQHTSRPGYWYLVNGIRQHRFNWRKSKLVDMGYDREKTEEEIMMERGSFRIYNAGNRKWVLDIKKV